MPAKSLKAADKQTILKKLVTEMKRRYGGSLPKHSHTAFETLLFAACLEDSGYEAADAAYSRLLDSFFDLNEIRVSSVAEVQQALGEIAHADWKAMRIREALQFIFEKQYSFDLEFLKRKTQEQGSKELAQIPHQTAFIRNFTIQQVLGAHVIPVDNSILKLLIWLGLVDAKCDEETAGEELKSGIKKPEAPLLCMLLKATSVDPELIEHFADGPDEDELDPFNAAQRLADLFKNPKKKKKPAPKAAPAKSAKSAPAVASKKAETKAVSLKKPAKKATASRPAATKAAAPNRKVTKKVPKKTKSKRSK